MKCINCDCAIEKQGKNYKNEDRWVHIATGNISCDLFATPPRENKE